MRGRSRRGARSSLVLAARAPAGGVWRRPLDMEQQGLGRRARVHWAPGRRCSEMGMISVLSPRTEKRAVPDLNARLNGCPVIKRVRPRSWIRRLATATVCSQREGCQSVRARCGLGGTALTDTLNRQSTRSSIDRFVSALAQPPPHSHTTSAAATEAVDSRRSFRLVSVKLDG